MTQHAAPRKSVPAPGGPVTIYVDFIWIDKHDHCNHFNGFAVQPDEDFHARVSADLGLPFTSILRWRYSGESTWYGFAEDGPLPGDGFSWYCPDCGEMYVERGHAYCSGPHEDDPALPPSPFYRIPNVAEKDQERCGIQYSGGL